MNDVNEIAQQIAWHYEQVEELQYSPIVNSLVSGIIRGDSTVMFSMVTLDNKPKES